MRGEEEEDDDDDDDGESWGRSVSRDNVFIKGRSKFDGSE
jgi:hypothetical protein